MKMQHYNQANHGNCVRGQAENDYLDIKKLSVCYSVRFGTLNIGLNDSFGNI